MTTTATMSDRPRAFPDPARPKAFYLARVRAHRAADELIRGMGWDGRRGCAVGCTLDRYDHKGYAEILGLSPIESARIAYITDYLFENLPENWLDLPERFLTAIPEGADLSGVYDAWCVRLHGRNLDRLDPIEIDVRAAIERVRDLHATRTLRDDPAWSSAKSAARSAESAARSAARSSAAWSAMSAARSSDSAWSAMSAAESAARSAARSSAAWSAEPAAARSAEFRIQAADLLELLASAPVAG